jgi:hypothetical protein
MNTAHENINVWDFINIIGFLVMMGFSVGAIITSFLHSCNKDLAIWLFIAGLIAFLSTSAYGIGALYFVMFRLTSNMKLFLVLLCIAENTLEATVLGIIGTILWFNGRNDCNDMVEYFIKFFLWYYVISFCFTLATCIFVFMKFKNN